MCAIVGIIGEANHKILKKMSICQLYRGPDTQKFFINKKHKISIGMNRLAVIDKKNGSQPMFSNSKRYLTVFNGAIYNFKEIKKFLTRKNFNFKTNSDTEVLVNSYEYWKDKCFNYLDGMWATAIYDFKKRELCLSRDYVGQKPIFYHKDGKKLVFSSQLNGLFKYKQKFELSKENYNLYLRFSHFPAPHTLYKKVFQVMPGEKILFSNKNIHKKKYWSLENGGDYNSFFKKDKKINEIFDRDIKKFLVADKEVVLGLSSGLDSKLLKKLMLNHKKKLKSFTIGFKEKSFDESHRVSGDKTNKNIKKILNKKDILESFYKIKKNIYFPFGDSSIIPTYHLFNTIKKNTNVSITGDGGDEIFFGYEAFKGYYLSLIVKKIIPNFLIRILKLPFSYIDSDDTYMSFKKKIKFFFKYLDNKSYLLNNYWISNFTEKDSQVYFQRNQKSLFLLEKLFQKYNDKMKFAQIYFIKYYLPIILLKVDFSSMINSVENRAPYLSKNLLNYSLDLMSNKNFSYFKNRKLMKKIFSKYLSNEKDIKKHGFAFNLKTILKDKKLVQKNLDMNLILNKDFFIKKYDEYLLGKNENEKYLWNEIVLNFSRQNLEYDYK
tara:strand:- start:1774 stop:3588 length:1815 start_codon:yes stop_codon:yes gene_type:complete